MKKCTKCEEIKSLECFSTNNNAKDKKHSWCRDCINKERAIKKYKPTEKGLEYRKEYDRKRKQTDSYKKMKSESDRKYREKMGEILKDKKRLYYSTRQNLRREEYQRNKSSYIARAYERNKNIVDLTPEYANKKHIQAFYDKAKELTIKTEIIHEVDHIIPVSLGGLHYEHNLRVITKVENRKKGNNISKNITKGVKQ